MKKKIITIVCIVLALCVCAVCVSRFVTLTTRGYTVETEGQAVSYRLPVIRYSRPRINAIIDPWDSVTVDLTEEELSALLDSWTAVKEHLDWDGFRLEGRVRVFLDPDYELRPDLWYLQIDGSRKGEQAGVERFSLYLSPGRIPGGKLDEQTNGAENHLWGVEVDACRWMWDEPREKLQLRFLTADVGVHFEVVTTDRAEAEELAARLARYAIQDQSLSLAEFRMPQERLEQVHEDQWGHMISARG